MNLDVVIEGVAAGFAIGFAVGFAAEAIQLVLYNFSLKHFVVVAGLAGLVVCFCYYD